MGYESMHKVENEPIFHEFCEERGISKPTIINYKRGLQKYVDFTGLTLDELIQEAEDDEDSGTRMRRRAINRHLTSYTQFLMDSGHKESYIKRLLIQVRTFYGHYDILLPRNKNRKIRSDKKPSSISEIPTIEDIEFFMEHVTSNYKAIITLQISSGMSKAEISSLTFKHFYDAIPLEEYPEDISSIIKEVKKKDNVIPMWNIKRIKTNHPYFTFSSPESVERILIYLEELHIRRPEYNPKPSDTLFRSIYRANKPLNTRGISSKFHKTSKTLKLRKVNDYYIMRTHNLRKFFATTLERNKVPHLTTRWLLGHTIDPTTDAYFKADPESLKQDYMEVIDQVTTNKQKVIVVDKYENISQRVEVLEKGALIKSGKIDQDTKLLLENVSPEVRAEFLGLPTEKSEQRLKELYGEYQASLKSEETEK